MPDISKLSPRELFLLHSQIEDRLLRLEIIRTGNNPTGDLAEHLFCEAFPDWVREGNSHAHYDAIGPAPGKLKYQIKARRVADPNGSGQNSYRQLSTIRDLKGKHHFNFLAGLLFNKDYSVFRAALIPRAVVLKRVRPDEHVNGHRLLLLDDLWDDKWKAEGVVDVTAKLRSKWY